MAHPNFHRCRLSRTVTAEEFAARRARAREAIGAAGLDWLLVIHPTSPHWLIGTEAKSYR
jgi:Xaa-Pro dipeptidase